MAPFNANSFTGTSANMTPSHGQNSVSNTNPSLVTPEALEIAGRCTENMLALDQQFPALAEKLRIGKNSYSIEFSKYNPLRSSKNAV